MVAANHFSMQTEELQPGAVCVHITGEFDMFRAYDLDQELRRIEALGVSALVIDLREVSFVDSAGLARILAGGRRATKNGHRFAVVRGCRAIERLFALTAADHTLEMVSEPDAVLQ
jgi:anti-sigma B factor antagonist/stage II sporulation protein AA (anti-sigma F factor antagonist)